MYIDWCNAMQCGVQRSWLVYAVDFTEVDLRAVSLTAIPSATLSMPTNPRVALIIHYGNRPYVAMTTTLQSLKFNDRFFPGEKIAGGGVVETRGPSSDNIINNRCDSSRMTESVCCHTQSRDINARSSNQPRTISRRLFHAPSKMRRKRKS